MKLTNFRILNLTCIHQLYATIFPSLRDAGRACGNVSTTCPVCRQPLSNCSDHVVVFGCGHGYHSTCIGEPKSCYKCLNTKGWAPIATNVMHTVPQPPPVSYNGDVLSYISYTVDAILLTSLFYRERNSFFRQNFYVTKTSR